MIRREFITLLGGDGDMAARGSGSKRTLIHGAIANRKKRPRRGARARK
jgi:hypothetical protein